MDNKSLSGRRIPTTCEFATDTVPIIARHSLRTTMLKNIDFIDAALCAVSAPYVHSNKFGRYGGAREGLIVIPAMGR
jgi:hypothetical protein